MEQRVSARKEYRSPTLITYGKVSQVTRGGLIGGPDSAVSSSHSRSK